MLKVMAHRLLTSLPTLFGVSVVAFALIRLVPGDPVQIMIGERGASPAVIEELRANLGLDRPLIEQYFLFVKNAVQGDFGMSVISKRPVWSEFTDRFPATIELGLAGLFWAILLGIPLGIIAAVKRNTIWDYSLMSGSLVGYSMPIFWWGLILILFFSIVLGWTPVSGRISVIYDVPPVTGFLLIDVWWAEEENWAAFKSALSHLILPAIALGTIPLAAIARMTRSSLLEVLREDYIRTAKAKGLTRSQVILRHALRNALIPIITIIGLMVGSVMTGAILTETIFSWPGIGRWLVQSVTSRDYPVIQGGVLLISLVILSVNLLVDLAYMWANPHIRENL